MIKKNFTVLREEDNGGDEFIAVSKNPDSGEIKIELLTGYDWVDTLTDAEVYEIIEALQAAIDA